PGPRLVGQAALQPDPARGRRRQLAADPRHARPPAPGCRLRQNGARPVIPFLEIDIDLDPNLFTLGPFTLTWHGVFSVLGILAAIRMTQWLAWRIDRIEGEKVYDAAFWAVVVGLLGARILYLVENYRFFEGTRWVHVFYVNEGGISQWGGIFGAMLGIWLWTLRSKVSF